MKAHKAGVRALAFGSSGHRFIFSAADDRQLLCTDIEVNKVRNCGSFCYSRYLDCKNCQSCFKAKFILIRCFYQSFDQIYWPVLHPQ